MPKKRKKIKIHKKSKLEDKLTMKTEAAWHKLSEREEAAVYELCEGYKTFLNDSKTEREAYSSIVRFAETKNFRPLGRVRKLRAGTRVYVTNRDKNVALAVIGRKPIEQGLNIIAAHIDAPRLDLKQNPLYEDGETELGMLKTHYYGGIKKYQWVNHPLALHGKVIRADGTNVDIKIGEGEDEPVFMVPDLLPHLWRKTQAKRKMEEGIKGEELNLIVGSRPIDDPDAKKKVKLWILNYLNQHYGMVEEDFTSAELEVVPAEKSRDVGFDRSMICGYGQDDRICAYTALRAIADITIPERTALALMIDKEEIGSEGATSIKSKFLVNLVGDLLELTNGEYHDGTLRKVLSNSKAISSDVTVAINPNFKDVHEKANAAKLGHGVVITKFTGSGGKYGSNDARAEYVGEIRRLFNLRQIPWQIAEVGKVDEGGGGTVAKFLAEHNMDVIDCGPPLLSMHSPYEISSKIDIYSAYQAYKAFFEEIKK
jgi:aspartyl aminopeptidase